MNVLLFNHIKAHILNEQGNVHYSHVFRLYFSHFLLTAEVFLLFITVYIIKFLMNRKPYLLYNRMQKF